jgi:hypothetical protein
MYVNDGESSEGAAWPLISRGSRRCEEERESLSLRCLLTSFDEP